MAVVIFYRAFIILFALILQVITPALKKRSGHLRLHLNPQSNISCLHDNFIWCSGLFLAHSR